MTRPTDVKPREGDRPGTRWDEFEVGAELPSFDFTISPEIVAEYHRAIEQEPAGYSLDGRKVAIPSVLSVYLMAVLYRRYPPAQGGIMAGNKFRYYGPISAETDTKIVASGEIVEKFEKRGRRYVRYAARFAHSDGSLIAEAENISTFPN
ncbi:hypothetical protein CQY20_00235 [Mycolicibacterium agri]|uniref:N-terminal of MaoC-like dehydratase domain-containing protein n=1 Tax=Mycolicibacterium agri TaxID=36811 RepID=A0A2A7NGS3_MYCAG|nr:hypothetical protein [Mycolicibacterium agri]PEG43060.1 hypothetical protein CQY20_00235 [Mycolicibacterium agri]GFG54560.1 hypothetical protein MAGR_60010 [Mycolicibacterium agri]